MYAASRRGEVEVHGHRRSTGEQATQVGQRRLRCVLGEHRDSVRLAEFAGVAGGEQQVRAPVQRVADLRPRQLAAGIDEREAGGVECGTFGGEARHQGPIGRWLAGRSNDPWRNLPASMPIVSGTCSLVSPWCTHTRC